MSARTPPGFRERPQNIEAEQAVLGAILINNDAFAEVNGYLKAEHFYEPVHARIYAAMQRHIAAGRLVDHVLLKAEFDTDEALRDLDGAQYLARIARAAESIINTGHYGRVVHDLAVKRGAIHVGEELVNRAYDTTLSESAADQIAVARQHLDVLAREAPSANIKALDWAALGDRKAPPRRFILPEWIPAGCVTLLHGFGGTGKTLLSQQIGTACILRCQFLGHVADACPVLAWFGEDDHDEIWRRQEDINAAFGINSLADLEGKLLWHPCPGDDITLFTAATESDFRTTPLFDILRARLLETAARLTILDSATQIAAIPEGNRPLVTRCLQALNGLCIETGTTIVLVGHNNRTGDFSGSSAWENRVRSRLHMKREKDEAGADTIQLCRPKANYAGLEEGVALEWHQGAYRCTDHRFETYGDRLERECRERELDQAFLAELDKLTDQRLAVSVSKQASNYAPKVMAANGASHTRTDFERAMKRLLADGKLLGQVDLWRRGNRSWVCGLGRKP